MDAVEPEREQREGDAEREEHERRPARLESSAEVERGGANGVLLGRARESRRGLADMTKITPPERGHERVELGVCGVASGELRANLAVGWRAVRDRIGGLRHAACSSSSSLAWLFAAMPISSANSAFRSR